MANCVSCKLKCLANEYITCGICCSLTHIKCSNLSASCINVINCNLNVVYRCGICNDRMLSLSQSKIDEVMDKLNHVKEFINLVSNLHSNNNTKAADNKIVTRSKAKVNEPNNVCVATKLDVPALRSKNNAKNSLSSSSCQLKSSTLHTDADTVIVADANVLTSNAANSLTGSLSYAQTAAVAKANDVVPAHLESVTTPLPFAPNTTAAANVKGAGVISSPAVSCNTNSSLCVPSSAIQRKRKENNILVVGANVNCELDVASRSIWLHISSFKPSVSAEDIIAYIAKHANIDQNLISCYKLIKRDVQIDSLKRVNFKLGISSSYYDKLMNPNLWPANVNVRPFKFFQTAAPAEKSI